MARCVSCEEEREGTWKCAGCNSKEVYCSKACQIAYWRIHIFDCYAYRRKIVPPAYHLARSCYRDLQPTDKQTLEDYGFNRAFTPHNQMMLLGLYQGLIKYHQISPGTVHIWKREGRLIQEIKRVFEEIPPQNRGQYYPWFLEHQDLLDPLQEPSTQAAEDFALEATMRAWRHIGGRSLSNATTLSDIHNEVATWPVHRRDCFQFYVLSLSHSRPSPSFRIWLTFGFCTTHHEFYEMQLGNAYHALLKRCSFEEFHQAYESSSLVQLFNSKDISLKEFGSQLADFLADAPHWNKSVWDLKQFVISDESDDDMAPSVRVDYGFYNCRDEEEELKLKEVYKKVFEDENGDPIKLHEACIQGKIYDYVRTTLKLKKEDRRPLLRRLMRNVYPLTEEV
jgi:MYND finger